MNQIEKMAVDFRNAIEKAVSNQEEGMVFNGFPHGKCGMASDLLAQYYIDHGIQPVFYTYGEYVYQNDDQPSSHAWLEVNGLVIDITGDQFKDKEFPMHCDTPVYIGSMDHFHQIFKHAKANKHPHYGLNSSWLNYYDLKRSYAIILSYLKK